MPFRFKDRIFEWWLASNTMGFGGFIGLPGASMDSAAYNQLLRWMPEPGWSVFFFLTGLAHLVALAINGRAWWTPYVRALTTAANFAVYVFYGIGFLMIDPLSTAVWSYSAMIASAAMVCFYRATIDAAAVWEVKRGAN